MLLICGEATFKIYLITYPISQINNFSHLSHLSASTLRSVPAWMINSLSRTELIASMLIISQLMGDIEEALHDLKSGKCGELDNIHAEHLNNTSNVLVVLSRIIQNKIPSSASPMVIAATVAPPCGRGGLDK